MSIFFYSVYICIRIQKWSKRHLSLDVWINIWLWILSVIVYLLQVFILFLCLGRLSYRVKELVKSTPFKGADPLILVKISVFFFLLENSLHVWGRYVLNFYKAIATRNAPKKGICIIYIYILYYIYALYIVLFIFFNEILW